MPKKNASINAANDAVKKKIPYIRAYEEEGIIETEPGIFTKCYYVKDITSDDAKDYTPSGLNRKFKELLNGIPYDISFQFVIHNRLYDDKSFYEKVLRDKSGYEEYGRFIDAYNGIIKENAFVGHNNVRKDTYFVISMKADLPETAVRRFRDIDDDLKYAFRKIYSTEVTGIALKTRLKVLYSMFNPGHDGFPDISVKEMKKRKLTTKDLIAPKEIDSKPSHKDYLLLNDDTYARSFFINLAPALISNSIIADITSISSSMLFSIQYEHMLLSGKLNGGASVSLSDVA